MRGIGTKNCYIMLYTVPHFKEPRENFKVLVLDPQDIDLNLKTN